MSMSPLLSAESSLILLSPALSSAFAHHGSGSIETPEVLEHGVEHLQGHIRAGIELIKYESEQVLFSKRNDEEEREEGLDNVMDASYALEFVRSEMANAPGGAALLAQANVSPATASQLLF